ncbi:MAG: hypothetical protein GYB33_22525 [Gammaproteobacteria bacterium]|nr:hypothetical protein [Gammaproteobacteria bacterium]
MNRKLDPWPPADVQNVVFLLHCNSKAELDILQTYLAAAPGNSPRAERVRIEQEGDRPVVNLGAELLAASDSPDPYLVPLRVTWQTEADADSRTLKDLLLGKNARPGSLLQRFWLKLGKRPYQVLVGKGAYLSELQARHHSNSMQLDLPGFIARSALLALDREERSIVGARYRVPRMLYEEVVGTQKFKAVVAALAQSSGRSEEDIEQEARDCLKEMAATPNPAGIDLAAALGRYMYTRGFDKTIEFAPDDLQRVRNLLSERPVAFLFTHKSHIDGFLLITLFHDLNLPPVHTFGGINMGFLGLGALLRNAGAIFIRRSFQGQEVYKAVFKHYIDYLGRRRFPLMWALEGTRSRTGKLMPPKFGLINYVVNAHLEDGASDLLLLPISIIYDQVPEVGDYDILQAGGKKTPESASWFMKYLSGLNMPHGKIHVRFGQGVDVNDYLAANQTAGPLERRAMQKMAFQLAVDVNNATPITVNSLICYVLLEHGHRAITTAELYAHIQHLLEFVTRLRFSITPDVERFNQAVLELALQQLSVTGALKADSDGVDTVYMIPHGGARKAAYYRNGLIHFFITSAIGEVALAGVSEEGEAALEQFHQEALAIRDILKYEFFFEGSAEFIQLLEAQLSERDANWRDFLRRGKEGVNQLFLSFDVLLGHGSLRPFLESYLVFARALLMSDSELSDSNALIEKSLALGKQRVLQQRIHSEESVSRAYFENAVKIAEGRQLFANSSEVIAGRRDLWYELKRVVSNVRYLASITEAKRLEKFRSID